MELGKVDKKILSYLYHNSREPLSKIAKACNVSREQVEYRIKKFEKNGLIKKYLTAFDYSSLGFNEFIVVWMKVSNKKSLVKNELQKCPNLISFGEVLNGFDLYADFVFKDKVSFEEYFREFLFKHSDSIRDYEIFISTAVELYPLKSFGEKFSESNYSLVRSPLEINLSDKDFKLLEKLDSNGRMSALEISNFVGMTAEGVAYKINQLKKKGVISGTRIIFDMEKAGFYFAGLRLKIRENAKNSRKLISEFCRLHKNINALSFGIGNFNCFVQFFYQEESELRSAISQFQKSFGQLIENSDLLLMENETHARMLPSK